MGTIRFIVLILFLVILFSTQNIMFSLGMIICKESERTTLLSFKQDLKDSSNSLSSWSGDQDCCKWVGVVCSNTTDHVIQLQLQNLGLGGELNPSLQELKQLRYLDLSSNHFKGISIPDFMGSLQNLRYLNLSGAGFSGMIPHQFGNFTSLAVLDLSNNKLNSTLPEWLYSHTNLVELDLRDNSFHGTISISVGNLTKLTVLSLSSNQLQGEIPITIGNLCKLHTLKLSGNKLKGEISRLFGSSIGCIADSLQYLYLSGNQLSGPLPDELGKLVNLYELVLTNNLFSGSIPLSIGRLSLLDRLNLGRNKLRGPLPESVGNLSKLSNLAISGNAFEGVVTEVHFTNLKNLQTLYMSSLVLKMASEWVPPFQLSYLDLSTCKLGPGFPVWIATQKTLEILDLSRTGLSGTIPTWFWNLPSQSSAFDLSHNELNGELPKVIYQTTIDLSFNRFNGQLPLVAPNVQVLYLSYNSFSGPISTLLCNPMSYTDNYLNILDLSGNLLSGDLSECWVHWTSLTLLRLGGNRITGKIPISMGSLLSLNALYLSNNSLSGELPSSLGNCTQLTSIDFGENGLTGRLPIWLGESLPDLTYLRLRSNKFYDQIPLQLCHLVSIRVLDIAHNDLWGSIPRCFNNFSAIATISSAPAFISWFGKYVDTTTLVTKGREQEYDYNLRFVTSLDLSKNSLSGEIPEELTSLLGLVFLNLSYNILTGKIPKNIGNMGALESLDFSNNNISGVIPQSISNLTFLSSLDLSYNNLSGKIPFTTQLQTFNESSFIGNQELCGSPLKKKCIGEEPPQKPGDIGDTKIDDEIWFEMKWFYMSMGVGFAVGFWTFWGVIVVKRSWRIAYFRFLDDMKDKLCLLF